MADSTASSATFNVALEPSRDPLAPAEEFGPATGVEPAPRSWPHTHGRSDVLVRRGIVHLVNDSVTPYQAMVDDLLFVATALRRAGLDFLLVRGNDERPVIAVDVSLRSRLEAVLTEACADEPMYCRRTDARRPPVLLADGMLAASRKARLFRLYRPRLQPFGDLTFGSSMGVELQLWRFGDDAIDCGVENSLTRRILPRSEAVADTVQRYGERWNTLRGMFDPQASDVLFDIDMVFSWVDGSDPEFQRRWAERMKGQTVGEGDAADARFRQIDELKYALRSVYLFAPWVRRIFIVTDSPRPEWLAEHPSVTIVRSEEFFSDPAALPTHNSQAVESQLHHIPGLSEHFIYSNDDMFLGRPVQPGMFFSPGGVTKFLEARTRIGLGESDPSRSGFENSARVNRSLLWDRFGVVITRHLEHAATPLRKSVLYELEHAFADEFARTQASTFRGERNISVTNSLYHYFALATGRAVTQESARVEYVDTTSRSGLARLPGMLKRRGSDFFCLNDGSFPEVPAEERAQTVRDFLARYFPLAAPWENAPAAVRP